MVEAPTYERPPERSENCTLYQYNLPNINIAESYYNIYLGKLQEYGFVLSKDEQPRGKVMTMIAKPYSMKLLGGVALQDFPHSNSELSKGGTGVICVFIEN